MVGLDATDPGVFLEVRAVFDQVVPAPTLIASFKLSRLFLDVLLDFDLLSLDTVTVACFDCLSHC